MHAKINTMYNVQYIHKYIHKIQKEIRLAYNAYLHSIITDQPENPKEHARPNKRFWTLIKKKKSDSKEITSLKSDGITYTKATDKANILNSQFKSVFTKLVPLKLKHLDELVLPRKLKPPTMPNIRITINGVSKQLSKLNPGKAAGPDNLSSPILKELHHEIAPMLTDIFNTSLCEGKVPNDWRNASDTPVYKKAPRPKQRITAPYHSHASVARSWSMSLLQTSCHILTSINFYSQISMVSAANLAVKPN